MPEIFDNEVLNASKFSLLEIENIETKNITTKGMGISVVTVIF